MPSLQQHRGAARILRNFLGAGPRYAVLLARCQAGKTGTFQELVKQMLAGGHVQRVYILCGSNETELRQQAIEDTQRANGAAYEACKITVLFRQDFERATMNATNALIVVDESHLDQTEGSQLDKFLARHGLSMDGNPVPLEAKNTYMLSVDATPYSELAALIHHETPYPKHVEILETGPGYYGLADYKGSGRLRDTFDIARRPEAFVELLRSVPRKWVLMRLSSGKSASASEAALRELCSLHGMRVVYFTASPEDSPQIDVEALETAPAVTTVVIIRGRLRAGKVVPKQHIGFVWEGAAAPKTDALVQGLPGRMCGYDFGGSDYRPLIFVSPAALKEYEDKVVRASEMGRAVLEFPIVLPTKGTNLKKGHVANVARREGRLRTQCPPLAITYNAEDMGFELHEQTPAQLRMACHTLLQDKADSLCDVVEQSELYTAEQKVEIKRYIRETPQEEIRVRQSAQVDYYRSLIAAYKNKTTPAEHISDAPDMTCVVYHPDYSSIPGAVPNRIFVVIYTDARARLDLASVHLESRIPRTTGRSIFTPRARDFDAPIVAGGVAGFREEAVRTPTGFEAALTEYLTAWRDAEALTFARRIQSAEGRFSLDKAAFHYTGKRDNDAERICARVGAAFGVELRVKFARSCAGAGGHFNIKEISW